jgi:predicted dehydrogenase
VRGGDPIRFAALGVDHRHIVGMAQGMIEAGMHFEAFWTEGTPQPLEGFRRRFPDVPRVDDMRAILGDERISLVLLACPPDRRAGLAIEAMRHGKDVMTDKPGCIAMEELERLRAVVAETGRIWSVNFSERFEVRAVTRASELVRQGRIGRVVQTLGIGPHRLNAATRPDWFFQPHRYGGILADIASHQIDQFLHFAGLDDAEVAYAAIGNFANPDRPEFQDFGEINLAGAGAQAYIRVDWYTPDAQTNWGDGRLFILGTEGSIELRKYLDPVGRAGTDHLFLVNGKENIYVDCADAGLPYFSNLLHDIRNRSETACAQAHTFKVCELALRAQMRAVRL